MALKTLQIPSKSVTGKPIVICDFGEEKPTQPQVNHHFIATENEMNQVARKLAKSLTSKKGAL
ncbi:MAG TPA: hypothetical protein PLM85_08965 [Nitrosomonas sp.]|nr:hypothetical protein [Nitrosomonas sp.]